MRPEENEIINQLLGVQGDNLEAVKKTVDASSDLSEGGSEITASEALKILAVIEPQIKDLTNIREKLLKKVEGV